MLIWLCFLLYLFSIRYYCAKNRGHTPSVPSHQDSTKLNNSLAKALASFSTAVSFINSIRRLKLLTLLRIFSISSHLYAFSTWYRELITGMKSLFSPFENTLPNLRRLSACSLNAPFKILLHLSHSFFIRIPPK